MRNGFLIWETIFSIFTHTEIAPCGINYTQYPWQEIQAFIEILKKRKAEGLLLPLIISISKNHLINS